MKWKKSKLSCATSAQQIGCGKGRGTLVFLPPLDISFIFLTRNPNQSNDVRFRGKRELHFEI
jgi:hypothetical protein